MRATILDLLLIEYKAKGWRLFSTFTGRDAGHDKRSNVYKQTEQCKKAFPCAEIAILRGGKCQGKADGYNFAVVYLQETNSVPQQSIYQQAIKVMKPEEIDSHESDLYLKKTPASEKLVQDYCGRVSVFRCEIDGDLWYDVRFAYEPFWKERGCK